jgi:hypothetical protein
MLKLLLSQFIKSNGRKPNNLEMILLRQKASKEAVNERKIVNMFDRQPVDANKPILGGKNIIETDEQMIQRFKKQNEDSINRLKNKKKPEDMAGGGVAGLLGERTGYNEGLTAKQLKRQDTKNLASKIKKLLDIQGSGTMSGKQQIEGEPEGITSNKSFINLIADLNIPISEKISLLGDVQYNKFREKIQKGNDELFLEDPASSINKRLGIGFDSGAGTTASAIKNLETGDNEFRFDIKKPIDFNKLLLRRAEGGPARQNFAMGKRAFLKMLGGVGAGIAGLKSGLLGFGGKQATKKAVSETVKQTAGSGAPPPYFINLVKKIKNLGDDAPNLVTQDRQKVTKFKDYTLTEDITTGSKEVIKKNADGVDEVYMRHSVEDVPTKKGLKKSEEYEELTAKPDMEGKMKDIEQGVPDEVIKEGTVFEDTLSEFGKADGGRIGYSAGGRGILSILKNLFKPKPKKLETVNDFISKRQFMKDIVGNTEKSRKARQLDDIKKSTEEYMKQYKGYQFPSDEQIKIDLEKRMQPILNKGRKLNATGGLANMLGE